MIKKIKIHGSVVRKYASSKRRGSKTHGRGYNGQLSKGKIKIFNNGGQFPLYRSFKKNINTVVCRKSAHKILRLNVATISLKIRDKILDLNVLQTLKLIDKTQTNVKFYGVLQSDLFVNLNDLRKKFKTIKFSKQVEKKIIFV